MSQKAKSAALNRINALLDDGSFVELGAYVTARNTDFNLAKAETPADGVLTGYGTIGGNLVYVYSQDSSVLGGSIGEMHAKKIANIYGQAVKMGAPVIGLIDCAGMRLQEATDALDGFGKLYLNQTMASGVIPQIQAVFGNCGGGMAVSAGLADFVFMETKNAKLFVNSPNVIEGNHEDKLDTAAAKFQAEAGLADFTGSEEEILEGIRALVSILPANNEDDLSYSECTDDLNRLVAVDVKDPASSLTQISDNCVFVEVRKEFAPDMVTGFIRLNGATVGAVANKGSVLTPCGCEKAAEFVNFCDAFDIPLLTLTDVNGYEKSQCAEKRLARMAAKLTYAFADATVPKVNIITGEAIGSAALTMNSSSVGADMVYAYPTAKIGMMDAGKAAEIICAGTDCDVNAVASEYATLQSSAVSAAKRGYVDDIIDPTETRKRAIAAFEMLFTKREDRPAKKHGAF